MLTPVSWKDQSGRQVAEPEFHTRHLNDPVLLSNAVYVKGTRSSCSSVSWDEIWKYSIAENRCSSLPTPLSSRPDPQLPPSNSPGEHELLYFVLSTYKSQLVCIGGYVYNRSSGRYSELNREVFVWTNNEWHPNVISPLPSDITWESFRDVSVSSNGSQLVLAWLNDNGQSIELLFYDDKDKQWKKAQGPKSTSSHTRVSTFLDKETIFVTKQGTIAVSEVYSASVEAALCEVSDAHGDVWSKTCFPPGRGICFLSNVTAVSEIEALVILVVDPEQPITLFVTEKIPSPDWKEIRKIELPGWQDGTYLSIIGLSNRELLIMYMCYTGTLNMLKGDIN